MALMNAKSRELYRRGRRVMVGGVSSPVRAFKAVGGEPLFITRGEGSKIWDVDGNKFIDYVCSWGALILGHSHHDVQREAISAIKSGSSFGAPTEREVLLAERISSLMPSIELIRFVNSGTEATMSALRLARAYTKRTKLVKFEGCYHGHADAFLAKSGSGLATFDIPNSEGITAEAVSGTKTLPYNNLPLLENLFSKKGDQIAAVIVEPVAGNMGVIPPEKGFLEGARRLCRKNGSLLIFDEVITGFRVAINGAQGLFGIEPDITCLGKIIGGGFPVGAYGGRKEVMEMVAPEGPVYQAGTLSGNPVAMSAGLAVLSKLNWQTYSRLERRSKTLEKGLVQEAEKSQIKIVVNRVASMLGIFFTHNMVRDYNDVRSSNYNEYSKFFLSMLESGVYLPSSAFETIFVSAAHTEDDINLTIARAGKSFRRIRR